VGDLLPGSRLEQTDVKAVGGPLSKEASVFGMGRERGQCLVEVRSRMARAESRSHPDFCARVEREEERAGINSCGDERDE
jgi:hypothetical protein